MRRLTCSKPVLLLAFLSLFCMHANAQRINYQSTVARTFNKADLNKAKTIIDDFTYDVNYMVKNARNLRDFQEIKRLSIFLDSIQMKGQISRTFQMPSSLNQISGLKRSIILDSLLYYMNRAHLEIQSSRDYNDFTTRLTRLKKNIDGAKLPAKEYQLMSTLIITLDYGAQVMSSLMSKAGSGDGSTAQWSAKVKCGLTTFGGAIAGALFGSSTSLSRPPMGAAAGTVIGGASGAVRGTPGGCF